MGTVRYRQWTIVALALVLLTLAARNVDQLINKPFTEDGFYALAIARNVGTGHGITIDGQVWTNGFQPLWVFLVAPIYTATGGHPVRALYGIVALHLVVYLLAALFLGRVVADSFEHRDAAGAVDGKLFGWFATVTYLASLFVLEQHLNGLETGLYLLILVVVARCYQLGMHTSTRGSAVLGALLGLLVLARVDSVFLVIILAASLLVTSRSRAAGKSLLRASLVSGTAFFVSLPWWVYNVTSFGSLVPISGISQQWWASEPSVLWMRIPRAYHALMQVLVPSVPTLHISRVSTYGATLVRVGFILGAVLLAARAGARWPTNLTVSRAGRRALGFAALTATWGVTLVAWYMLSSGASHFYERYWAPLMLVSVAAWAVVVCVALGRRTAAIVIALLCVAQVAAVVAMHTGSVFRGNEFYRDQLALVRDHAPADSVVAAAQTGTLGYFRDKVINLDGKVNPDALRIRQGNAAAYLSEEQVRWFVDWPNNVTMFLGRTPQAHGWEPVAERGRFKLYRRVD